MKTRGVNVILIGRKEDNYGYLKITIRKDGKTIWHTLGIKVLKKDFNSNTQRMRQSAKDANNINNLIEDKLKSNTFIPYNKSKIKTICSFMQSVIDITNVLSTKQKYENLLTLFKTFIKETYKKDDLYFEEIDSYVIAAFRNYLLTKDNKNSNNTTNYKLKSFKSFFSKLEKEQIYHYNLNPFFQLKLKFDDTSKNYLNINEFKELIKTNYSDTRIRKSEIKYSLNDIKDAFIFSTLAQGLRISDILTLRWNDFQFDSFNFDNLENLVISKKMIKTKKIVNIFINSFGTHFIINQILRCSPLSENEKKNEIKNEATIEDYLNELLVEKSTIENEILILTKKEKETIEISNSEIVKKEIVKKEKKLSNTNQNIFTILHSLVQTIVSDKQTKTMFVFPFLSDNEFNNIDEKNDFSQLTQHQFLSFQGKRSYINKLLKDYIFSKLTNKKLSFHSARHTYTSLILSDDTNGLNVYDLMKSLGHTNISSTEKYMKGFNYKKLSSINTSLTKSLREI